MAKDAYYFPHDYNARNDRKIAALVKKHKAAGYGVFWITCEMMHEEDGSIEFDEITFGAIAKDSNEDLGLVKTIITDCIREFKLFKMDDDIVISGRVSRNLEKRQEVSKSRAIAGQKGAIAQQNKAKERKEIKEKKEIRGIDFSPDLLEVIFPDGSRQELGQAQQRRLKEGNYEPHYIKKGEIE
jgi:hypothetical protein